MTYSHVRFASWRWMIAVTLSAVLSLAVALTIGSASPSFSVGSSASDTSGPSNVTPGLAHLASTSPSTVVEVIVQIDRGTSPEKGRELVKHFGGVVTRDLALINGFGVKITAGKAVELAGESGVRAVSRNARVEKSGRGRLPDAPRLNSAYIQSVRADKVWPLGYTGEGVGVAVIDTGIAGDLPDFRESPSDSTSRVVATAVVNPGAENAGDSFGHGTHIAGLIAGNGSNRDSDDPLFGKYSGVAPDANLISVKASDEDGNASVMDVIDGLQFAVDHKDSYNIRVVNLSLRSTVAESYKTDPLDAAVEAAWFSGLVVVAAAGNDGSASDAVSYAPGNDPYVISVGSVDDQGTKKIDDDKLTSWSSRGNTQDGFSKPEMVAPGAKMVSTMGPGAKYRDLCPECVVDDAYFRVGGTSMSAAVVSGEAALLIQENPDLTPDQIKGTIIKRTRAVKEVVSSMVPGDLVDADGQPVPSGTTVETEIRNAEAAADKAIDAPKVVTSNTGLTPNELIDPATGQIDYSRASWSRASWSEAADPLRASWSRASWSRASWSRASWSATLEGCSELERASWSRASWSRASWSRASWSNAGLDPDTSTDEEFEAALTDEQKAELDAEIAEAKEACAELERASWSRASWSRASWSSSFTK